MNLYKKEYRYVTDTYLHCNCILKQGPASSDEVFRQSEKMKLGGNTFLPVFLSDRTKNAYVIPQASPISDRSMFEFSLLKIEEYWLSDRGYDDGCSLQTYHRYVDSLPAPQLAKRLLRFLRTCTQEMGLSRVRAVHGDATVENCVVLNAEPFWIDPSVRKVPLFAEIDVAKLLMSARGFEDKGSGFLFSLEENLKDRFPLMFSFRYGIDYFYISHIIRSYARYSSRRDWFDAEIQDLARKYGLEHPTNSANVIFLAAGESSRFPEKLKQSFKEMSILEAAFLNASTISQKKDPIFILRNCFSSEELALGDRRILVENTQRGPAMSALLGAGFCDSELPVIFVDSDAIYHPSHFTKLLEVFEDKEIAATCLTFHREEKHRGTFARILMDGSISEGSHSNGESLAGMYAFRSFRKFQETALSYANAYKENEIKFSDLLTTLAGEGAKILFRRVDSEEITFLGTKEA